MYLIKSRQGQGTIGFLLVLGMSFLVWAFGLSSLISSYFGSMVAESGITGWEAWFITNINLFIFLFYLIGFIVVAKYGY